MKHIFFISFFLWNIIHQTDANIYVHLHVEKSAYRNISQLQISPVVSTSKLKRDESRYILISAVGINPTAAEAHFFHDTLYARIISSSLLSRGVEEDL